jgi:hypothetical protein
MSDTNGVTWATLTPTGGLQVGQFSFYIRPSGDIEQDSTNSALLGNLTVRDLTVTGAVLGITGFATNGQWNASVAGASNYADTVGAAVGLGATNYADTVGAAAGLVATNFHVSQGVIATNAQVTASNALAAANGVGLVTTNFHLAQGVIVSQNVAGIISVGLVATNAAAWVVAVGAVASNAVPWLSLTSAVTTIVSPSAYKTKASYDAEITNSFRLYSGTVTQDQVGVHNQGFFNTTNLWIPLGSTNWVKFEGKLNVF